MNNNRNLLIGLILVVAIGIAVFAFTYKGGENGGTDTTAGGTTTGGSTAGGTTGGNNVPPAEEMIHVSSPVSGATIDASKEFTLSGEARGGWFFEANAPFAIFTTAGDKLTSGHLTAQGEWMTTGFVSFTGTVMPFLTRGATDGYVEFENDNPSDNEGFRRSLKVPVKFAAQTTQTIKVYFGNEKKNPNSIDCTKVYAVDRVVPKTSSIGALALQTMLMGPSEKETVEGYISIFGNNGSQLNKLTIANGVATADFNFLPSGGSCAVTAARAQIESTLKQFSTVTGVTITKNGSTDGVLEP